MRRTFSAAPVYVAGSPSSLSPPQIDVVSLPAPYAGLPGSSSSARDVAATKHVKT